MTSSDKYLSQVHLITPFYRLDLKEKLVSTYLPMNIIWYPIMFQDEKTEFNESWIIPHIISSHSKDCKALIPGNFKRNLFIKNCEIIDNDYYVTVDDDDAYEAGVFDKIKRMDNDIIIISMKRGYNIPRSVIPSRRYPTNTLIAAPEAVNIGSISGQQLFVKGRIFKKHLFDENSLCWDGEMAIHHKESGEQIRYEPNLYALFNFFEAERWEERKRMTSIIIPVFNQDEMTRECINSIREHTDNLEFIIIDNGSEPPLNIPFVGFADMLLIRSETNQGFPVAVNQGIMAAHGDIIILLNNDVIVTPGWSEKLVSALDEFAIVGPVTNYCAGLQKVQIDSYESLDELSQASDLWAEHYVDSIQEVTFVIGFCMAFKKSLFDEIGEFDESVWPCSGEEVDFCFRAREKGYRVGIVNGCYVHHEGSKTFEILERDKKLNYADVCKKTDEHLNKKWGGNFWERQAINSSPEPKGVCLNLGSGYRKLEGFINIDNRAEVEPDLLCSVLDGLPYSDNSVDMIRADDFLEHIPIGKTIQVITEIWRVLKPGGIFESSTPDAETGQGAFQDPNHVSFWVENSWLYYSDPAHRDLYGTEADFEIESITRSEIGNRVFHLHVIAKARK